MPTHRWASWIAGFSGEFAGNIIAQFLSDARLSPKSDEPGYVMMDPFARVGTTLVEANSRGLDSIGFEINPFAALVCRVKLGATDIRLRELRNSVKGYASYMENANGRTPRSSPPAGFRSRIPFFSPAVERKVLLTQDYMSDLSPQIRDIFSVALASVMVEFSSYTYEPSLG